MQGRPEELYILDLSVVALLAKPQAARRAAEEEAGEPKATSAKIYVSPGSATRQVQLEATSI